MGIQISNPTHRDHHDESFLAGKYEAMHHFCHHGLTLGGLPSGTVLRSLSTMKIPGHECKCKEGTLHARDHDVLTGKRGSEDVRSALERCTCGYILRASVDSVCPSPERFGTCASHNAFGSDAFTSVPDSTIKTKVAGEPSARNGTVQTGGAGEDTSAHTSETDNATDNALHYPTEQAIKATIRKKMLKETGQTPNRKPRTVEIV